MVAWVQLDGGVLPMGAREKCDVGMMDARGEDMLLGFWLVVMEVAYLQCNACWGNGMVELRGITVYNVLQVYDDLKNQSYYIFNASWACKRGFFICMQTTSGSLIGLKMEQTVSILEVRGTLNTTA